MSVRISSTWMHQQGVLNMQRQQAAMAKTQNQLASNQKWMSAADDPSGFASAQSLDRLIAQTQQYTGNAKAALQRLQIGEDAIASGEGTEDSIKGAQKRLGKAGAKGIIHKNQAARPTSRLMRRAAKSGRWPC